MSSKYYPVFLSLEGRHAVVVGGGSVADVKAAGLLEAGADVTVVSPRLTRSLQAQAERGVFKWIEREYQPGDLESAWIAIAATDKAAVNAAVAEEAEQRGILLNIADRPSLCSFIAPAVVRRDDLVIAISTGGKSPAMARRVREEMERLFPPEYGQLLELAAGAREELRRRSLQVPPEVWQEALSDEVQSLVKAGQIEAARTALMERLGSAAVQR